MQTTLYLGPPGTGKTKTLLDIVDKAIEDGIQPEQIAYLAFTRKAAQEAVHRATAERGMDAEELPYFRTLHSLAFHQLGLSRKQTMGSEQFTELGHALGMDFQYDYDNLMERAPTGGGIGDRALRVYSLSRAKQITIEQAWEFANDPDLQLEVAEHFAERLVRFKSKNGLYDFTDILDACQRPLPVKLFILDECQDLTPQQWALARRLSLTSEKRVIAGDDDQAIFEWAGADITRLLRLECERKVLPISYRLPRAIWNLAEEISGRISQRFTKTWSPRQSAGSVSYLGNPDDVDLSSGTWLLLARHQGQLRNLEALARRQGVVYHYRGLWSNRSPVVRAVIDYERLRRGEEISEPEAQNIMAHATPREFPRQQRYRFHELFQVNNTWMSALDRISDEDREYIRSLKAHGENLSHPGRVIISTIHAVKGGEADNVLLLADMNMRVMQDYLSNPDQELRVWYVAVTRAKENLFVYCRKARNSIFSLYF